MGRIIFNRVLNGLVPYVNEPMSKKKLEKVVNTILQTRGIEPAAIVIDDLKLLGFEMATVSGITWATTDLIVPVIKKQILAEASKEVEKIRGLPQNAKNFIDFIEDFCNVPISIISVGPAREETIVINEEFY